MSLHCQMNLISICQPLYNLVTINYVHWLPEQIKQSSRARFFGQCRTIFLFWKLTCYHVCYKNLFPYVGHFCFDLLRD